MPLYKVWSSTREVKKAVIACSFTEFVLKGKEKLGFSKEEEVNIYTNDDGTEVEEDTFLEFGSATIFIMTRKEDPAGDKDIESAIIMDDQSGQKVLKAPKHLSEDIVKKNSMIFGFNKKSAKLTAWQEAVNNAAFQFAKHDPDLLYNRAELKIKAEAEARKTYVFKKPSGSRSIHVQQESGPKPKRSKTSSDERKEQVSSVSIQLELIKNQISSKQQLCSKASAVKDFALCSKVQGEMRKLFQEKANHEKMLKMLQTKERKSTWYQKKKYTTTCRK
ncbi:Cell death activator CIDE-B [Paramuricea clavata]|uniref:Cell death activator CIDE-B n=1 Tax=Paramuricea clavata TaxID=317549 RepID=A0A6S7IIU3_PARCT|nr:Cell death activator CIDE-B [Paramuricea clavata]